MNGINDHNGENAERLAEGYKNIDRKKVNPELFSYLELMSSKGVRLKVLDIGSGAGNDAILIASMGHFVVGVEPSDLRKIAERDHSHPNIDYRNGRLPLLSNALKQDEIFDVTLLSAVLQYIHPNNRVESLIQIGLVLKEDGRLYINYPSPPSRPYQYEITDIRILSDFHQANLSLSPENQFPEDLNFTSIPDSRGRKSLDGRVIQFHNYEIIKQRNLKIP